MKQGRFQLDKRNVFILRTARKGQRLPRLSVQGPSFRVFKTGMDNALHDQV